jgi:hypothetical protein
MAAVIPLINSPDTEYSPALRGILFENFAIIDESVKNILVSITDTRSIIPYRYLKTDFQCTTDPFLGHSCVTFFKKGNNEGDFQCQIAFTFGYCNEGLNENVLKSIESSVEILVQAHKDLLATTLRKVQESAEGFAYFNKLYDDAVNKLDKTAEIATLQIKADSKESECTDLQKQYDTVKATYENESATFDENKSKINELESEIQSLSFKKQALETEQIDRNDDKTTHEQRVKNMETYDKNIDAALQLILKSVDPNFFDGVDCFKNGAFDSNCTKKLNSF